MNASTGLCRRCLAMTCDAEAERLLAERTSLPELLVRADEVIE